jgi:hypothetical protein
MRRSSVPPVLPAKGEHSVTLSWRASAPANSKHDAAVGYCIYRSLKPKDPSPELVNSIPFPGTTCTDDRVANDTKYYYVVRAINAKGRTSINSNEAPAAIPSGKSPAVPPGPAPPLCRETAREK